MSRDQQIVDITRAFNPDMNSASLAGMEQQGHDQIRKILTDRDNAARDALPRREKTIDCSRRHASDFVRRRVAGGDIAEIRQTMLGTFGDEDREILRYITFAVRNDNDVLDWIDPEHLKFAMAAGIKIGVNAVDRNDPRLKKLLECAHDLNVKDAVFLRYSGQPIEIPDFLPEPARQALLERRRREDEYNALAVQRDVVQINRELRPAITGLTRAGDIAGDIASEGEATEIFTLNEAGDMLSSAIINQLVQETGSRLVGDSVTFSMNKPGGDERFVFVLSFRIRDNGTNTAGFSATSAMILKEGRWVMLKDAELNNDALLRFRTEFKRFREMMKDVNAQWNNALNLEEIRQAEERVTLSSVETAEYSSGTISVKYRGHLD